MTTPKAKVLFLCTRNSVRSQMAEALLRRHAGEVFDVHSAGVIADPIHPYAIEVMREIGVDIGRHSPRPRAPIWATPILATSSPFRMRPRKTRPQLF